MQYAIEDEHLSGAEKDRPPPADQPPAAETTCDTEPPADRLRIFVLRPSGSPGMSKGRSRSVAVRTPARKVLVRSKSSGPKFPPTTVSPTSSTEFRTERNAMRQSSPDHGLPFQDAAAGLTRTRVHPCRPQRCRSPSVRFPRALGGLLVVREGGNRRLKARRGGVP